jgi:PAS domain S-box-containing protein
VSGYRKSILFRLNVLVIAALLPALGVILYNGWKFHRTVIENTRGSLLQLAQAVAFQHEGQVQGLHLLLATLAEVPCVRAGDTAACERLFRKSLEQNPFLHDILLATPDGRVIGAGLTKHAGATLSDRKYFRDALATGRFSAGEYEPGHPGWYPPLNFCLPVRGGDGRGRITRLLVASLDLDAFAGFCRRLNLPEGSTFNLSDHRGVLVYRYPRHNTVVPGTPDRPELRRQMTGPDEEGSFFGVGRDDVRRLLAFKRLRLSPDAPPYLYIRLTVPESSIRTASLRNERNSLYLLALSTLGALAASCVLGGPIIGRRLKQLVAATRRVGQGELAAQTGIPHDESEIGQVAASFDDMARRLESVDRERKNSLDALRTILQTALDGFLVTDLEGRIHDVNEAFCVMTGYAREELLSMRLSDLETEVKPGELDAKIRDIVRTEGSRVETRHRRKDGTKVDLEISTRYLAQEGGKIISFLRDITGRKRDEAERRRLQIQMQNAQKLESLGVLAGGIAHDFNNLLLVILGNIDLVRSGEPPLPPAMRQRLSDADKAAQKAAELCRQMLAYTGGEPLAVERVDIALVVKSMVPLLEMSVSKKASLRVDCAPGLPSVPADPGQLRQVVMNLVVNASEALEGKTGVITLSTRVETPPPGVIDEGARGAGLPARVYACIEVTDNGCGMKPAMRERIFDPFFSTKFTGRGLGLAAVLGIVRAHHGGIAVESRPGKGSRFRVYIPLAEAASPSSADPPADEGWTAGGVVLLVDDEEMVRDVGAEMLAGIGFRVILAVDGVEALERYREHRGEISLVILDLTMPRMDGEETLKALRGIDPGVRVLIASGYREEGGGRFEKMNRVGFLPKPYRIAELRSQVRRVLERA